MGLIGSKRALMGGRYLSFHNGDLSSKIKTKLRPINSHLLSTPNSNLSDYKINDK